MWLVNQLVTTCSGGLPAPVGIVLDVNAATLSDEDRRQVAYLMLATLAALVTLVVFVLGVFIVKRMGARLRSQRVGGQPTKYVDSWSQYRLSDEEIDAATAEDEPPGRSDRWDDEHGQPPGRDVPPDDVPPNDVPPDDAPDGETR